MRSPKLFCLIFCIAASMSTSVPAQEKPFYLHDGDTVVFYGDSITEQRYYTYWVELYTATRFPRMHVHFYNAGVGGDRVSGGGAGPIDTRLTRDVFPYKPSVVTIMLGMNDGGYRPLTTQIESVYTLGYEHILSSIKASLPDARLTLLGPSPYDDVTRPEMFPGGYNATLIKFASIDNMLAKGHKATFIDLNAPFVAAMQKGNSLMPTATQLLLPDRVHPEQLAHWFMAATILKGWNAPALVSSTSIDAKRLIAVDLKNTHVTELNGDDTSIHWTELDDALPLPLDDKHAGIHFVRQLMDIEEELNEQPLRVTGLKAGSYQLVIDNGLVGKFTDLELAKGVNLADLNTPMRGQAARVGWNIRDREETHAVIKKMYVTQMLTGESREQGIAELGKFEEVEQKLIEEAAVPRPHDFVIRPIPVSK